MIHDRMNEDGTSRRLNGMLMSVQSHRISIYFVAVTISKNNLPAAYDIQNSNNDNYGGDDDEGDGDGGGVVVDHSYSYSILEEKEQAERVSCKAFLCRIFKLLCYSSCTISFVSFFFHLNPFFPLLFERK